MLDYRRIINKSLHYIEKKLTDRMSVEDISDRSCYSLFHYHRIFQSIIGLNVKQYIRKRRLSEAANELTFTNRKIIDIARKYQFDSQESFTRAFKKEFNVTPGKFRREKTPYAKFNKMRLTIAETKGDSVKPEIKTIDSFKVVGMKCKTTQKENKIPELWNKFMPLADSIKNQDTDFGCLGVCFYVPNVNFTDETEFEYMACRKVSDAEEIHPEMEAYTMPQQKYAIFKHIGALDTLGETYHKIHAEWLPQSGFEMAEADEFELYNEEFKFGEDDSVMYIYIPVK